jgi:hypothetical protein
MKKTLRFMLATALLVAISHPVSAKDAATSAPQLGNGRQIVGVLSLSGSGKMMDNVRLVDQLTAEGFEKQIESTIADVTQGKGLDALDTTRPWGIVLSMDGDDYEPLGFVPVKDSKKLLDATTRLTGTVEQKADGVVAIKRLSKTLYMKEQNGWLFIGPSAGSLAKLPADPSAWLAGLDKQYDIGIKLYVQAIPEKYRGQALGAFRDLIEDVPSRDGEGKAIKEKRLAWLNEQAKELTDSIKSVDQFSLGWKLNPEARTSSLDVTLTALPGSELADQLNVMKTTKSNYTGFMLKRAAALLGNSQSFSVDDSKDVTEGIGSIQAALSREIDASPELDADARAAAKRILGKTCDAIKSTILSGKVDLGGSVVIGDRKIMMVAGAYVGQPAELENAFQDLMVAVQKDPSFPATKINVVTDGDIRYYTWTSPVDADKDVNRAVGKELKTAVGFGPKSIYVGVGSDDPLPLIKTAITDSKAGASASVAPGVLDWAVQPILNFAKVLNPDDKDLDAVVAAVAKAPGKDHIHVQMKPQENGVSYAMELQEGVLKALVVIARQQLDK